VVRTYGQYCPIARGAEIFAERWTPVIIRNLWLGCDSFSEILEGAPGLSRTLLAQRLNLDPWTGISMFFWGSPCDLVGMGCGCAAGPVSSLLGSCSSVIAGGVASYGVQPW
jgi:hypothetical protein